jgi:hypothetical protein
LLIVIDTHNVHDVLNAQIMLDMNNETYGTWVVKSNVGYEFPPPGGFPLRFAKPLGCVEADVED